MRNNGQVMQTFSDYLIYDERKGRVLHSRFLNRGQFYDMWRLSFNALRPDLFYQLNHEQDEIQRMAVGIQGYLRNQNLNQLRQCYNYYLDEYPGDKCYPILKNHMNYMPPAAGNPLTRRVTDWRDAAKNHRYVRRVMHKVESYGLNYPSSTSQMTPDQLAEAEEQLYEYFMQRFRETPEAVEA